MGHAELVSKSTFQRFAALLALSVLVFASCGGDGNSPSADTEQASSPTERIGTMMGLFQGSCDNALRSALPFIPIVDERPGFAYTRPHEPTYPLPFSPLSSSSPGSEGAVASRGRSSGAAPRRETSREPIHSFFEGGFQIWAKI